MGLKNAGGSEFRSGSRSVGKQVETWRNTDAIGTRRLNSDIATNTYNPAFEASGGNVEQSPGNGYSYHVFYSPGTFNFKSTSTVDAKILIVAGGGGGGNHSGGGHYCAGGGGAGGLYDLTMPVDDLKGYMTSSPNPVYTHTAAITIGDGGVGGDTSNNGNVGTNGGDSQFGPPTSGITVSGGGGGGGASPANGNPGGSGGGGAGTGGGGGGSSASPPIGPQGNAGGAAGKNPSPPQRYAGGGGGAGGGGSPGPASGGEGGPGHGVDWIPSTVLTEPTTGNAYGTPGGTPSRYFAGGGGGAPQHCPNGSQPGGEGGGGSGFNNGTNPSAGNGTAWTGGGGGAKSTCDSGSGGANTMTGGSGICIIRVSTQGI